MKWIHCLLLSLAMVAALVESVQGSGPGVIRQIQLPGSVEVYEDITPWLPKACVANLAVRPLKMIAPINSTSGVINGVEPGSNQLTPLYYTLRDLDASGQKDMAQLEDIPVPTKSENGVLLMESRPVEGMPLPFVHFEEGGEENDCLIKSGVSYMEEEPHSLLLEHCIDDEQERFSPSYTCLWHRSSRRILGISSFYDVERISPERHTDLIFYDTSQDGKEHRLLTSPFPGDEPRPVTVYAQNHQYPLNVTQALKAGNPMIRPYLLVSMLAKGNLFNVPANSSDSVYNWISLGQTHKHYQEGKTVGAINQGLGFSAVVPTTGQGMEFDIFSGSMEYIAYRLAGKLCLGKFAFPPYGVIFSYFKQPTFSHCDIEVTGITGEQDRVTRYVQPYRFPHLFFVEVLRSSGQVEVFVVDVFWECKSRLLRDSYPELGQWYPKDAQISLHDGNDLYNSKHQEQGDFVAVFTVKDQQNRPLDPFQISIEYTFPDPVVFEDDWSLELEMAVPVLVGVAVLVTGFCIASYFINKYINKDRHKDYLIKVNCLVRVSAACH